MLPRYFRFDTADSTRTRTQQLELVLSKLLELVLNNSNSYLTTRTRTQLFKLVLNNSNSYLTTRTGTQQLELVLNNSNSYSQLVLNNSNSYSTTRTRTRTQQLELELKKFIDVPSKLPYIADVHVLTKKIQHESLNINYYKFLTSIREKKDEI